MAVLIIKAAICLNTMKFIYEIAGVRILCTLPFEIIIREDSENFIKADDGLPCELHFDFHTVEAIEMPQKYDRAVNTLVCGNKSYFCLSPDSPPYACVTWDIASRQIVCEYLAAYADELRYSYKISDFLQLETLLAAYDGILLHSSFISANGKGILFSAPSGTGKSTQADLWAEYENADILNGDRAAIRRIDGSWSAYGLPYAGSSRIFRNESVPLAAIVILRQAKENKIRRLRPSEAWKALYSETTAHIWDRDFISRTLSLLESLASEVPVYLLECLPDKGAVDLARDTIFKEDKA